MDTIEQLELFKWRAEQLRSSRLIAKGFNPGITVKYEKMQGTRFESREPDEDDLRSFLPDVSAVCLAKGARIPE